MTETSVMKVLRPSNYFFKYCKMMQKIFGPCFSTELRLGTDALISTNLKPDVQVHQQNSIHGCNSIFWLLTFSIYLNTILVFSSKTDIQQFNLKCLACVLEVSVFTNKQMGKGLKTAKPRVDPGNLGVGNKAKEKWKAFSNYCKHVQSSWSVNFLIVYL